MKYLLSVYITLSLFILSGCATDIVRYDLTDFGIVPDRGDNMSSLMDVTLRKIQSERAEGKTIEIKLQKGRYDFNSSGAAIKEYFISNHDQDNPKAVGIAIENMDNLIFDGQGSELIFHGRMIPISLIGSKNVLLKNFSIDFAMPHVTQVKVLENNVLEGSITFEVAPWVNYVIRENVFYALGEGWEIQPSSGIAFEEATKRLVFNTSDIAVGTKNVVEVSPRILKSTNWRNDKLIEGTVIALRGYPRPTPGIFMSHDVNTTLENIQVHYAEGMGLLAQMSEDITLDSFSVCLRGDDDPRYFTAQADATHFSACKGKIVSKNGLYEGMMDDAINIHGTYLKVIKRIDDNTLVGSYMHNQSWGFEWGRTGDSVQFIDSKTMELIGNKNAIKKIRAFDKETEHGAKEFEISFTESIDPIINEDATFGIENIEWTPEVVFANNTVRNNRARGALFSTPKKTIIENNTFDHTSGTAILLCGDCNGWFETGACTEVIIRNNHFVNALTNQFQFTNAIISIFPVIPDLQNQKKYFHSNILIEGNTFETFDIPIVYAKSVDGLTFRNNVVKRNNDYPAFHWNKKPFLLERVTNIDISNNDIEGGFNSEDDIKSTN